MKTRLEMEMKRIRYHLSRKKRKSGSTITNSGYMARRIEAFSIKYGGMSQTRNWITKHRMVTGKGKRRFSVQQKVTPHMAKSSVLMATKSGEY